MQVNITSISQTSTNIITLVANVVYDGETTINISSFSYNLDGTGVTPTSISPSSGSFDESFILTLTFSRTGFADIFVNGLLSTYTIYYDGTNMAETQFTYGFEILYVEFTLTDNQIITAAADIIYYETPVIISNFTYNLTYSGGSYTNATPTTQNPADGTTETGNFTLTLTFSIGEFPNVVVDGLTTTYNFLYDGYSVAQFPYAPTFIFPTFDFISFTVSQINFNSIDAAAEYSFTNIESAPTDANFTYTVLIGTTTYTYTTSNPYFTPTVGGSYFNFTFSSAEFPELFEDGILQTHTLNYFGFGLSINSSPEEFTYDNTVSLTFTGLTVQLEPGNLNNVEASFSFTYTNFQYGPPQALGQFYYVLNGTLLENNTINWNISTNPDPPGAISGFGTGFARFTRQSNIFIQAASITHLVRYVDGEEVGPFNSSTVTTVFTLGDSNNITITNPVTIITINNNKTIILPPVDSRKGILYHFKILTATDPYTLKIFPYLVVSPPIPPLLTKLYTTSLTYDSVIEGVAGPLTMSSTRNTLTLISDGTSWSILNRYTDTLTIGALTGTPTNTLSEVTETKSFQYTYVNSEGAYYSKILLSSSTSSYLKYIFITNADSSPLEFTIYLPISKAFETSPAISSRYALFTFTIPAGKVAGFILTYVNDTYYIISASINPSISTEGTISATPTIISSTVSLLQNQPAYQISYYLPNFDSSISQLLILKTVSAPPTIQGEANVSFQLTKDTVSLFSPATGSAVWFIGYQFSDTRQYYLPVCYYLPPA